MEQMMGVEPTSSAWKANVLAVVRHLHKMAERVGFEPTGFIKAAGFQDRFHKPLEHLSSDIIMLFNNIKILNLIIPLNIQWYD